MRLAQNSVKTGGWDFLLITGRGIAKRGMIWTIYELWQDFIRGVNHSKKSASNFFIQVFFFVTFWLFLTRDFIFTFWPFFDLFFTFFLYFFYFFLLFYFFLTFWLFFWFFYFFFTFDFFLTFFYFSWKCQWLFERFTPRFYRAICLSRWISSW